MTQTCPRRMSDFGPWKREEGLDDFTSGHGIIGQARGCTFCGSMAPDDFMEAARTGAEMGPTDKSYKVYVQGWAPNGRNGGKFYFQHLSVEQQQEFIDLLNAKTMNIGYPGHFYTKPFFVTFVKPGA